MNDTHQPTGTDADFQRTTRDKSLGRDAHGRPMITIPRHLLVNQAPPRREGKSSASSDQVGPSND